MHANFEFFWGGARKFWGGGAHPPAPPQKIRPWFKNPVSNINV